MLDLVEFWTNMLPRFVLPRFGANGRADSGRDSPPWLRSALDAMRSEDNLRGGVPRLLELAHVSPAHLWRTARRIHGVTPSELVRQLQIRHASMLLGTTDDSIGSVGARAGFASASHFSKAFRRAHSMSPREYRTRVRHSLDGPPRAAESGEDRLPVPPD